jgi:hypothetical protein
MKMAVWNLDGESINIHELQELGNFEFTLLGSVSVVATSF